MSLRRTEFWQLCGVSKVQDYKKKGVCGFFRHGVTYVYVAVASERYEQRCAGCCS